MEFVGVCLITDDVVRLSAFDVDGAFFAIYAREAAQTDMRLHFPRQPGSFTLQFGTENVDDLHEKCKAVGVAIVKEPTTYAWGNRSMQIRDPDGNIVTFACRA
jgi:uncharacterized glyoxalase superfamily protein PhnB